MKNIQKEHFESDYTADLEARTHHLHNTVFSLLNNTIFSEGIHVLDIGAGRGSLLKRIPDHCRKNAIDISETSVRTLNDQGIEAVCLDLDETSLPYNPNSFDYIFCLEVIEHLTQPAKTLKEIHRVLRPSGKFIISVPNMYQLATPFLYIADIPPVNSASYGHLHVNDFTVRIMKKALIENGFFITQMAGDEIFPLRDPVSRWIARRIPRLAHHLIAICDKSNCSKPAIFTKTRTNGI